MPQTPVTTIPEIVPVLDLAGGRAVHARGGDRSRYAPVRSVLAPAEGDAMALAQAYRTELGASQVYLADLDAITGGAAQVGLLEKIGALFPGRALVDAGVSTANLAQRLRALGATVVVGLETLASFEDLAAIADAGPVCFSLDLRNGRPVLHPAFGAASAGHSTPSALAQQAVQVGATEILALDLARVGSSHGPDSALLAELRAAVPGVRLLIGGGIRNLADLVALGSAGCDAALVGTAIHEGQIRKA